MPAAIGAEKGIANEDADTVKKHGKRKAARIALDKLCYEGERYYDMSLWRALLSTTLRPWLTSVLYNAIARKLQF